MAGVTVQSGATSDLLTIDATSKAFRGTLYDTAGIEINVTPSGGAYTAPINLRHTAATAAGSKVWAMRNGNTKTMRIRTFFFTLGFDGTAIPATNLGYSIQRYGTGGSANANNSLTDRNRSAIKKRSSYSASTLAGGVFDYKDDATTGLTWTSNPTFETDAIVLRFPCSVTNTVVPFNAYFLQTNESFSCFELAINEGITILVNPVAAIIGQSLTGFIEWDEV